MEYKASLDPPGKIITIAILLLFGWIAYRNLVSFVDGDFYIIFRNVSIPVVIASAIIGSFLFAPRGYIMDANGLTIKRAIGNVRIKFDDFEAFKRLDDPRAISGIRVFGVGGLFGYFGIFYLPDQGWVTGYATKRTGRILIVTRQGKRIIVTPDDPGFVDELRRWLAMQTYSLN